MRRVLVTGATGFVARALVPRLEREGFRIVAALRTPREVPWLAAAERRLVGEIGPDTPWLNAFDDIDSVVHLAARVHVMRESSTDPLAAHRRTNAAGTAWLARNAAKAGVRRLVYVSTLKVNGETTTDVPFTERDAPEPVDPYGISKWEGEQAIAAQAAENGLETVVIRPPLVYGPGIKGNMLRLFALCDRGIPLPLASVRNRRSLIAAGNLADIIARCLDHPGAAGGTFLVCDGEDVSTPDLIRRIAAALGRPARLVPMPETVLRAAGRLTGKSDSVARLLDSLTLDDGKLRQLLDWTPPVSVDHALAETAAWYKRGDS